MDAVFHCKHDGRRQALLEQTAAPGSRINAIDFLVVVDGEGLSSTLRQRVLLVKLVFADHVTTLVAGHVRIEGGVRVREPEVRWAMPMPDVVAPGGPAVDPTFDPELDDDARTWLADRVTATAAPDEWLVVRVAEPGDHSRYTLRLRGSGETPPPGFDRKLSEVELSFKIECPSPFDCATVDPCGPVPATVPQLDYLARDFGSFRRLMLDRLALLQPGFDDRDPATLRTTIVEMLAWAADQLAYHQDAVATEAYLDTARRRPSVRRHARLLDYPMHEGCNARAFVHLRIDTGLSVGTLADPAVPIGARFSTRVQGATGTVLDADAPLAEVFEALVPTPILAAAHDEIALHTWGDGDCCLPIGATTAALQDPDDALQLAPGDFLVLEEVSTAEAVADPSRRQVVRLVEVGDRFVDELLGIGVREVRWHDDDALVQRFTALGTDGLHCVARGNLVLVDHGRTIVQEPDPDPALTEDERRRAAVYVLAHGRGRRAKLRERGLTWRQPIAELAGGVRASASTLARQDPRAALPDVSLVDGDGTPWQPQRDLLESASSATDFAVEMEEDGRAWLRFGDGSLARAPAEDTVFARARYRVGNGLGGNVGAESIAHAVADPITLPSATASALVGLRNPLPAVGGIAPEPIDAIKLHAPSAFRRQERAVTVADWSEIAERDPAIQRAVARVRWTGSGYTVFVHVDRKGGLPVELAELPTGDPRRDEVLEFRAALLDRLERHRLVGYDLEIAGPRYVAVDIAVSVCVQPGFLRDDVERRLRRELGTGLLPDGRRCFFHPDELTFGQTLWLSPLVARMNAVAGVHFVDVTLPVGTGDRPHRFKRWGRPQGNEVALGRITVGALEIIRCDNDPDHPDNGRLELFMEGGA